MAAAAALCLTFNTPCWIIDSVGAPTILESTRPAFKDSLTGSGNIQGSKTSTASYAISRPAAIFISVAAAGLLAYAVKTGTTLRYADERQYVEIAQNISAGRGFVLGGVPTAYRPPAWPLLLSFFLLAGLPASLLVLVPVAAMIAAATISAAIGVRLSGSPIGAIAGVAVLVYPLNVYTATTMYPQAFATMLVVSLWLIALLVNDRKGRRPAHLYILAGFVTSVLALSVPTLAFTGLIVSCWIMISARGERVRAVMLISLALLLPTAVWTARNAIELGSPIALSTTGGMNLLIGNNPTATGSSGVNVDINEFQKTADTMGEAEGDKYLRDSALEWIFRHPSDSSKLYLAKVANYFAPYNAPVTLSQNTDIQRLIAQVSFALLVSLVLVRLMLRKRLAVAPSERLFLWLFVANSLVMAVFFTRTRFRQPLDSILLIEAAIACVLVCGIFTTYRLRQA
jgi:hypothetical protein